jgi:N-methylhydantoinase B
LPGKIAAFALDERDVVVMQTAGGGGFGNPRERASDALANDLRFGYVTEGGRDAYRAAPPSLKLARVASRAGRRRASLAPATAAAHGVRDGSLIEILTSGPSLRAWIVLDERALPGACGLDAEALAVLDAAAGETVTIHAV